MFPVLKTFENSIYCLKADGTKESYKLINCFEIDLVCINIQPFQRDIFKYILDIKSRGLDTNIFCVLPNRKEIIMECISYGIADYVVVGKYSTTSLLCRIQRILHCGCSINHEIKNLGVLHLNLLKGEIYIKGKIVKLTCFECIFLNFLLENRGICNIPSFTKHYSLLCKKNMSAKCIVVYVNRLRKKIYHHTGDRVIKCKYGFGYYIDS